MTYRRFAEQWVKNVIEVNAFDIDTLEKTVKEEVAKDEVIRDHYEESVCIAYKGKKPLYIAHADKCKNADVHETGLPAMTRNEDGTIHIDDTMCTGCGLCERLCKFKMRSNW